MTQTLSHTSLLAICAAHAVQRPLCVNLDGTLVATDTLWEGVVRLMRSAPWTLLLFPWWLVGGRARFKREVAVRAQLDPNGLPYRQDLIEALRQASATGRKLVLATSADQLTAETVARHLGCFEEVLASDGRLNLRSTRKRERLEARYGLKGFDYVGDSSADLPILRGAALSYMVGVSRATARRVARMEGVQVLSRRPPPMRALIKELRPHQWAKNALVFVPVLLSPSAPSLGLITTAALATGLFSLVASAGYVLNDLLDLEADRAHATKKNRPFASGALPVKYGPPLFLSLLVCSFSLAAWQTSPPFVAMLAAYFVGTMSYSLWLKRLLMLDVLTLAWLYTHRVLAGGVATEIPISQWLLAFSLFMFLSLAFQKRYIELRGSADGEKLRSRGYSREDIEIVSASGVATGYMAVLIFSLYIESTDVRRSYSAPLFLWGACPVLIYWISRMWFLAHRGQVEDDPVKFALRDKVSWLCGLGVFVTAALARLAPRLFG